MVRTMNYIMAIYDDILSYIQFSLEFKPIKTFVIKSDDYLLVTICYLFCRKHRKHIYTLVTILVYDI